VRTEFPILLRLLIAVFIGLVIGFFVPAEVDRENRWDLEVTGKLLLSEEACQAKDLAGPCGEVWWLNSIGEKVYRTWPANSECYRETRTGYDLLDSCRN
tara:strand:+ start:148 stop:444 length:297 start_codon:yes stop_codon:yes gene_type:complete